MAHKLQIVFEELCAIYFPEKAGKNFCARATFEYCKQKDAVILTIDHNAGAVSDAEMDADLSFTIVRRLVDKLEQTVPPEASDAYTNRVILTIGKGGDKQHEN